MWKVDIILINMMNSSERYGEKKWNISIQPLQYFTVIVAILIMILYLRDFIQISTVFFIDVS